MSRPFAFRDFEISIPTKSLAIAEGVNGGEVRVVGQIESADAATRGGPASM